MTNYEQRLQDALIKQEEVKNEIAYLRLQIKQELKQCRWAKGSPIIKQFQRQWPDLHIDNGPGITYLSLSFSVLDVNYEEHLPVGWEKFEERSIDSNALGSPILKTYRMKNVPALLYVTKAIC